MQQIGVFGASFDPPTIGHTSVIEQALKVFDEILLVPSLSHPFLKNLAPIADRLAMLKLFLNHWQGNPDGDKVKIYNVEAVLQQQQTIQSPIYTYDVLSAIEKIYQVKQQDFQLRFIVGPDIAKAQVWQKFYRYQDIEKQWPLFIAQEIIPVHSTMVREAVAQHGDITPWVGEPIARYIFQHGLYQAKENSDEKQ